VAKKTTWIVRSTTVGMGAWLGNLDLIAVPLNDHAMILGQDFLKSAQAIRLIFKNCVVVLGGAEVLSMPMVRKSKLGWKLRISMIKLVEAVKTGNPPQNTMQWTRIRT
jgi:hypothetical protein